MRGVDQAPGDVGNIRRTRERAEMPASLECLKDFKGVGYADD